jgi:putative NADPH-quinone reductase
MRQAYAEGAREAGHEIESIEVARLDFPMLRSKIDWDHGEPPPALAGAREAIRQAQHLVIVFPFWLGGMPAPLKGFMEQILRPGIDPAGDAAAFPTKALRGRSARIVVTTGMPSFV